MSYNPEFVMIFIIIRIAIGVKREIDEVFISTNNRIKFIRISRSLFFPC